MDEAKRMKAVVRYRYGPPEVLRVEDRPRPVPGEGEVLVKVHAASVNAVDWHLLRGRPLLARLLFGFLRPRFEVLGVDVAGHVEAVGPNTKRFGPGDEVFGDLSECGWGGFAEYARAREDALLPKPAGLGFEHAAAVPLAAVTALQGLRDKGRIQAGQHVLVNGAGGGVGTFAVQIAKALGAHVTGVCSPGKVEVVRSLGADQVIDRSRQDFTRNGTRYDVVFDAAAYRSILDYRRTLKPGGAYVMVGGDRVFEPMLLGPLLSLAGGRRMGSMLAKPDPRDLAFVTDLIAAGKVVPVVDRSFALSEVPEALQYLESGRVQGKIVIAV